MKLGLIKPCSLTYVKRCVCKFKRSRASWLQRQISSWNLIEVRLVRNVLVHTPVIRGMRNSELINVSGRQQAPQAQWQDETKSSPGGQHHGIRWCYL